MNRAHEIVRPLIALALLAVATPANATSRPYCGGCPVPPIVGTSLGFAAAATLFRILGASLELRAGPSIDPPDSSMLRLEFGGRSDLPLREWLGLETMVWIRTEGDRYDAASRALLGVGVRAQLSFGERFSVRFVLGPAFVSYGSKNDITAAGPGAMVGAHAGFRLSPTVSVESGVQYLPHWLRFGGASDPVTHLVRIDLQVIFGDHDLALVTGLGVTYGKNGLLDIPSRTLGTHVGVRF